MEAMMAYMWVQDAGGEILCRICRKSKKTVEAGREALYDLYQRCETVGQPWRLIAIYSRYFALRTDYEGKLV